jgi:hypothetical protein
LSAYYLQKFQKYLMNVNFRAFDGGSPSGLARCNGRYPIPTPAPPLKGREQQPRQGWVESLAPTRFDGLLEARRVRSQALMPRIVGL